jgi:hypothetical protein
MVLTSILKERQEKKMKNKFSNNLKKPIWQI